MLSRITPYLLPSEFSISHARVDWPIRPRDTTLLVHDMQNCFLKPFGTADLTLLTRVVANINTLRVRAHELGIPVVFSTQPGGLSQAERGLLQDFWGDGPAADPRGLAIVDSLAPRPSEIVISRRSYSAFTDTKLDEIVGPRGQLIITGVYAHVGVLATALDAFMREVQPFVIADAVADFSPAHHRDALHRISELCGVVATTAEVADHLPDDHSVATGLRAPEMIAWPTTASPSTFSLGKQ